jgi:hypothetical protein
MTTSQQKSALSSFLAAILLSGSSGCAPNDVAQIDRQMEEISAHHKVSASAIIPTHDGGFIITGGNTLQNLAAWAIRMDSEGHIRWEFLDGNKESWTDTSSRNNRFDDAVELADDLTLLCGVKLVDRHSTLFLDRVDAHGRRVDERLLLPHEEGFAGDVRCLKWGPNVAVVVGLSRSPHATGWFMKLDAGGNLLWEKYGDAYNAFDSIESLQHELLLLSSDSGGMWLLKLDSEANVVARHEVPVGALHFIRSLAASSAIRIGVVSEDESKLMSFDDSLRGPTQISQLKNVYISKAFELQDHSLVIFGNQRLTGATASVTRAYTNGTATTLPLPPLYASQWVVDASPTNHSNQFVTIREINGSAVIAWISVK